MGNRGGFNPFRDANGEYADDTGAGKPGRSRAGGPLKWTATPTGGMNAAIRAAAAAKPTPAPAAPAAPVAKPAAPAAPVAKPAAPAAPVAFGADRTPPTYKPAGYALVTDGDYQALRSTDRKAVEIWEGHQFRGFADPGEGKAIFSNATAAIGRLRAEVDGATATRKADARQENARRVAAGQAPVYREMSIADVPGFIREHAGWFATVPEATRQQMMAFQETGDLNNQIRSGRITNQPQHRALLAAMRPNDEAMVAWRGVNGAHLPPLKPGATFTVKEFSSSSITPDIAVSYARDQARPVVMKIRVPEGQPMLPMLRDGRGLEMAMEEVLLPPGMTYRVVGTSVGPKGVTVAEVEIVKG